MKIILIALSLIAITVFSRFGEAKQQETQPQETRSQEARSEEEDAIKAVILGFFDAMRDSDSTGIRNSLTAQAIFQTISAGNEVKTASVPGFVTSIGKAPRGSLDEKISFAAVLIDGTLASVWTPYRFYVNGNFSHCGVNSFQLHKENGFWKIHYVIDTRRKTGCID